MGHPMAGLVSSTASPFRAAGGTAIDLDETVLLWGIAVAIVMRTC